MATIKDHIGWGPTDNDGTESCDFRGLPDDALNENHRTFFEKDFGPDVTTNDEIEAALRDGPAMNRGDKDRFAGMKLPDPIAAALKLAGVEGPFWIRRGVWDA